MVNKIAATLQWLPSYFSREISRTLRDERTPPKHIYFCFCDHYEPYCSGADKTTARTRIQRWQDEYWQIRDAADMYGMEEQFGKGKLEGKIEGKIEIAIEMIKDGETHDRISKYTGLTDEEIEKLRMGK